MPEVPHQREIAVRMRQNAAKDARRLVQGTPEWEAAVKSLEKDGVEYGSAETNGGILAAVRAGKLDVWLLADGTDHITERGFGPGNTSLS